MGIPMDQYNFEWMEQVWVSTTIWLFNITINHGYNLYKWRFLAGKIIYTTWYCPLLRFLVPFPRAPLAPLVRIPPDVVPDHQIHALCAIVDTDFSGTVDIEDGAGDRGGVLSLIKGM